MMIGFWILLIGCIFVFYKMFDRGNNTNAYTNTGNDVYSNTRNALAILNERYAKGEISQEEYKMKKMDLIK